MRRRPAGQLELRVAGPVTGGNPVVVLGQDRAVRAHEDRPERLVAGVERLGRELDAPAQMLQLGFTHHGVPALLLTLDRPYSTPCGAAREKRADAPRPRSRASP